MPFQFLYFKYWTIFCFSCYQESWEDEDEEKKEEIKQQETEIKKPKKKTLQEKINEKEVRKNMYSFIIFD